MSAKWCCVAFHDNVVGGWIWVLCGVVSRVGTMADNASFGKTRKMFRKADNFKV